MRVDDRRFGRDDDRQVRDGHPRAVEHQTLGRVSAGRTSEGVPLNAAYRRPIGANVYQAHLSAACQTFHSSPRALIADGASWWTKVCPQQHGVYLRGRGGKLR